MNETVSSGPSRRELLWLGAACGLSLVVHGAFVLSYFGEPDAARLALDALRWLQMGHIEARWSGYRVHTSPLYLHALHTALALGLQPEALPAVMSWGNVLTGSVALMLLYLLCRRVAGAQAAALTCVLYSFTPVFFAANIYGMPHTPALCFFLASALAFSLAYDAGRSPGRRAVFLAAAVGSMFAAVSLKADIALAGGALLGLLVVQRSLSLRSFAAAALVMLGAAAGKLLYSRALIAGGQDAAPGGSVRSFAAYMAGWRERFPFSLDSLLDPREIDAFTHASGPFLHSVWVLSILALALAVPKSRRLLVLAALWAVPLWLFWAARPGNSARHNLAVLPPVLLCTSVFLCHLTANRARVWLLGAGILALNYLSDPRERGAFVPQSRIFHLALELERNARRKLDSAHHFVEMPGAKKAFVGGVSLPYMRYLLHARAERVRFYPKATQVGVYREDLGMQDIRSCELKKTRDAVAMANKWHAAGYHVWSPEHPRARRLPWPR